MLHNADLRCALGHQFMLSLILVHSGSVLPSALMLDVTCPCVQLIHAVHAAHTCNVSQSSELFLSWLCYDLRPSHMVASDMVLL